MILLKRLEWKVNKDFVPGTDLRIPEATCTAQKLASLFEGIEKIGVEGLPPSFTIRLGLAGPALLDQNYNVYLKLMAQSTATHGLVELTSPARESK